MVRFNRTSFKKGLESMNQEVRPKAQPLISGGFSVISWVNCQLACKPGSVWPSPLTARERGGHSSWAHVAMRLTQPTRTVSRKQPSRVSPRTAPIRFCSRWGLPCRSCCQSRGGLLPHPFTLTTKIVAVCFLWHFPWGRPRRPLTGTVSPWSPDFPHPQPFDSRGCGRPASWQGV